MASGRRKSEGIVAKLRMVDVSTGQGRVAGAKFRLTAMAQP